MRIIQPYDLSQVSMQGLIDSKSILPASENKVWQATIFPASKTVNLLVGHDKDHIVTMIDDALFSDFVVLDKVNQNVLINNNTARKYIKSVEIGDFNDSIKRYAQLDKPIDYNTDAQAFLNIPQIDYTISNELNVSVDEMELIHQPADQTFAPKQKRDVFASNVNHPHINTPQALPRPFKNNNKAVIHEVFKWALAKGIKYIYCINEYRPHIISNDWATPYVYYTVRGSF